MAGPLLRDRVQETTTTTGTGTLTLAGASPQFQSFAAAIGSGNSTFYGLVSGDGSNWEVGSGTVGGAGPWTLSRDTVLSSSNANTAIRLAGTSTVFGDAPAKLLGDLSYAMDIAFGTTEGQVVYRGAAGWVALAPGTAGQVLASGGAGADVAWATGAPFSAVDPLYLSVVSGTLTVGMAGIQTGHLIEHLDGVLSGTMADGGVFSIGTIQAGIGLIDGGTPAGSANSYVYAIGTIDASIGQFNADLEVWSADLLLWNGNIQRMAGNANIEGTVGATALIVGFPGNTVQIAASGGTLTPAATAHAGSLTFLYESSLALSAVAIAGTSSAAAIVGMTWVSNNGTVITGTPTTISAAGNLYLTPAGTLSSSATGAPGGPTWTGGAGVPTSVQPNASLYSRTDGATGSRLYVSAGGGTWNPVASV